MTDQTHPWTQWMRARISCRTYLPVSLPPENFSALQAFLSQLTEAVFPGRWRFEFIDSIPGEASQPIGTYGTIRGARTYLAGVVERAPHDLENFGFLMETAILYATGLGFGTCWLGGAFHNGQLKKKLRVNPGEVVPAITPIGTAAEGRSLPDRALRWSAKSNLRKPWDELFFTPDFSRPLDVPPDSPHRTLLEMVRIAPSASNRQPWRITADLGQNQFRLYLRRTPGYGWLSRGLMRTLDLQRVDIGIALCHFTLTARELGVPGKWSREPGGPGRLPEGMEYIATWTGAG